VQSTIKLASSWGGEDGYRADLPLERDIEHPIVLDASDLDRCHPAFIVRMRLFFDWHLSLGHEVGWIPPHRAEVAQQLADAELVVGLPEEIASRLPSPRADAGTLLPLRRLGSASDVEDVSQSAIDVLHAQAPELAAWGDPVYMAVSELCSNALQHGGHELGAYVMADRVTDDAREFRLVIADLGIGIPEHIRSLHPDWIDDSDAIMRVLVRGVTGTRDPHRGNGFAEVLDEALDRLLVRSFSAVNVDIRSSKGRAVIKLVDGRQSVERAAIKRPRRGTWITYVVTTV
jgi:hypothetical protein